MLRENLDELQQTVNLMQSDNHDEFYDISIRNKKYGRVDPLNGPMLLEKCVITNAPEYKKKKKDHKKPKLTWCRLTPTAQPSARTAPLSNLSSRFAIMK